MNLASLQTFIGKASAVIAALYPATLTFGAVEIACARGPWRGGTNFDDATQTESESRIASVRVKKTDLSAESITIVPGATDAELDGVLVRITEVTDGGSADDSLHLVCAAVNPEEPQS